VGGQTQAAPRLLAQGGWVTPLLHYGGVDAQTNLILRLLGARRPSTPQDPGQKVSHYLRRIASGSPLLRRL
jgi:hypothetical protein